MAYWAPIVHGRTYEVDYRSNLIVVPDDFKQEDIAWAKQYILGTFETLEVQLNRPEIWVVFANDQHCVVGVTCMAHRVSSTMFKDRVNRPLTVFLGYVSKNPFPTLPPMQLEHFKGLYRWVEKHWWDKSYEAYKNDAFKYDCTVPESRLMNAGGWSLNWDPELILARPVTFNDLLWAIASNTLINLPDPLMPGELSVCLGLPNRSSARRTSFLNVTTYDIAQYTVEDAVENNQYPENLEPKRTPRTLDSSPTDSPPYTSQKQSLSKPSEIDRLQEGVEKIGTADRDERDLFTWLGRFNPGRYHVTTILDTLLGNKPDQPEDVQRKTGIPAEFEISSEKSIDVGDDERGRRRTSQGLPAGFKKSSEEAPDKAIDDDERGRRRITHGLPAGFKKSSEEAPDKSTSGKVEVEPVELLEELSNESELSKDKDGSESEPPKEGSPSE